MFFECDYDFLNITFTYLIHSRLQICINYKLVYFLKK